MVVLHQAVQDGVGNGGVAEPGVPVLDRLLTGDEGGLGACAVMPQASSSSTSVLVSRSSHEPKVPLPWWVFQPIVTGHSGQGRNRSR